jgi:hypothetical protein
VNTTPQPQPSELPSPAQRPGPGEWIWLLLLLGGLLGFNLATYNQYPAVWCDEVSFSEPAINFLLHGSFTTTVWQFQPPNTFPVVNCPLYPMALVPWLTATGTSLLAVRSFNYTLMAVAAFLLWVVSWRFELVKTAVARLLLVVLFHLGYGMSFAYRCSRPDVMATVCLLVLLLAFKIPRQRPREFCLLALSAATVWIGLQVALFAWIAALAGWLLLRRVRFVDIILLSLGMALGLGTLLLFLSNRGVLAYFLPQVLGMLGEYYAHGPHLTPVGKLLKVLSKTSVCWVDDLSTLGLAVGLVLVLVTGWTRLRPLTRLFIVYCLLLVFGIPAFFNALRHYEIYYAYTRFVPATLALFAAYSDLALREPAEQGNPARGRPAPRPANGGRSAVRSGVRYLCLATAVVAMGVGLPLRLALGLACSRVLPRTEIQRIVSSLVSPEDVVFSDDSVFFEVKQIARLVYELNYSSALAPMPIRGHNFTAEEKRAISLLVIRPQEAHRLTNFFGGQWQAAAEAFGDAQDFGRLVRLPFVGGRIASYALRPQTERYPVQIFRRPPG